MEQKKRWGKSAICPQCRGTRFFAVNFNRTPEGEGDTLAAQVNCENCNRLLHWFVTRQEWEMMKAEYKSAKLSEKKNV